jgi:hypothetical protein
MSQDNVNFDQERFETLVRDGNYLGAWSLLKAARLDRTEESIRVGFLANSLVSAITAARVQENREDQAFKRSMLAYILKDWPGLASLYREQTRQSMPAFLPDNLQDLWQEFSDVLGGRKTLDESFRQRMEEAGQKAREFGVETDTLRDFARDAEREIRRGVEEVGDFLKNIFQAPPTGQGSGDGQAGGESRTARPDKPADTEEPAIKVKIQDADDPLPKDIHQAPPVDKEK